MAKQEKVTGFDPETVFNEGRELGISEAEAQLHEQIGEMAGAGMQPNEIEQALFDPAPRRGRGRRRGKIKCSAKQRAAMPQICTGNGRAYARQYRRTFDPAPRGGYRAAAKRYYKRKGGAKGLVAGLRPLILPGSVLATVYGKYLDRAKTLKAEGALNKDGTPVDGVFQALMYDIQNRPTTSVMDRMKTNASKIITPAIMGVGLKYGSQKVKLHPKINQVAGMGGDALIGVAIGKVISTFLDPPENPVNRHRQVDQQPIHIVQPTGIQAQQPAVSGSYVPYGGY